MILSPRGHVFPTRLNHLITSTRRLVTLFPSTMYMTFVTSHRGDMSAGLWSSGRPLRQRLWRESAATLDASNGEQER